jgi:formylglycine-generating enzyme required for sulfatase activity
MKPAEPGSVINNSIGMKLTLIPAGSFIMGSPEGEYGTWDHEGPQHKMKITRPFYLGVSNRCLHAKQKL